MGTATCISMSTLIIILHASNRYAKFSQELSPWPKPDVANIMVKWRWVKPTVANTAHRRTNTENAVPIIPANIE